MKTLMAVLTLASLVFLAVGIYSGTAQKPSAAAVLNDNQNFEDQNLRIENSDAETSLGRSPSSTPSAFSESGLSSVIDQAAKKFLELEACYAQDCGYSAEDPRAYDLAVQRAQSAALLNVVKSLFRSGEKSIEAEKLALKVMTSQSPFVQQRGLEILSTQPPSANALRTVVEDGLTSISPKVVSMAMDELLKYMGTALEPLAHEQIVLALMSSDRISVVRMLSRLSPFVHKMSFQTYESLQGQLAYPDLNRRLSSVLNAASERI
ncbi:MAG: hypothetical protein HRT45_08300 [Bdellovibrionales bacterium]|nr:hypothetical protein [Bdellovibrionales bacterium]